MVRNWLVQFKNILANRLVREVALRKTDSLDETLGQERVTGIADIDNLILYRRTATIKN
jgi:hypothetical protein